MSILIKGMEMPTGCDDCEFCKQDISGYDWCCVPMMNGRDKPLDEPVIKPDWCPLIPVPKHGRLGDLDELERDFREDAKDPWNMRAMPMNWADAFEDVADIVADAPTIIPAEEGK